MKSKTQQTLFMIRTRYEILLDDFDDDVIGKNRLWKCSYFTWNSPELTWKHWQNWVGKFLASASRAFRNVNLDIAQKK